MEKTSKPKVILLIETSRVYGRALLRGITKYSRLHGPWVFYSEPGGLEKVLPRLKGWGANGIIMRDSRKGEEVIKMGVPVIVSVHLKEQISGFPYIDTDGVKIGEMAAEHFLDRGLQWSGVALDRHSVSLASRGGSAAGRVGVGRGSGQRDATRGVQGGSSGAVTGP